MAAELMRFSLADSSQNIRIGLVHLTVYNYEFVLLILYFSPFYFLYPTRKCAVSQYIQFNIINGSVTC